MSRDLHARAERARVLSDLSGSFGRGRARRTTVRDVLQTGQDTGAAENVEKACANFRGQS